MYTMGKVHSLQTFPWGLWGVKLSSKTYLLDLSTLLNKIAISNFYQVTFGEKGAWEGG